ncbi:PadR family transcriptional regulator [Kribbella amoyensis]|uniref:PadR family transcriptional regulator n=1 Tax=Kribbella amoyensis TaxID=996641 RepID=A0A561BLT9_9ACTN|nr:helix-turn-helix transcriptional regulator [Kribbella amoyensis]TWD79819.1 PadR family transcriptional regulator [Kribbella amoyensis]
MAAELTPLGIAVLALLNERPMHAYEMYQLLIKRRNDQLVKVRPGSLYHTVERLAGHELVEATGTERSGNRPERTTYAITPAGQAALIGRVQAGIETFRYEYPLFPVVLGEAHNLDREDALERFRRRVRELDRRLADAETSIADATERQVPEAFWMAGDYIRTQLAAERDWLVGIVDRIENEDLAWSHRTSR